MQFIKNIELILLLLATSYIGVLISKKYLYRVKELKDMKNALNIFATKINFTYEPIPEIFMEISKKVEANVGNIFYVASKKMDEQNAGTAWMQALETEQTNMNKEDIEVLKGLSNLLGRVDLEGQIGEIKLVEKFLDTQINKAEEEKGKYSKLYKSLGVTIGLAIVIILL